MFWRRRFFTSAESFQLYIEGLRNLQLHENEAGKLTFPSEGVLDATLSAAERRLTECVGTYPKDLLPRYYLGLVQTLQAQAMQARQLRADVRRLRSTPSEGVSSPTDSAPAAELSIRGSAEAELLYEKAAANFNAAAAGKLQVNALYNRAQTLAKYAQALGVKPKPDRDQIQSTSEKALAILDSLRPIAERVRSRVQSSRLLQRLAKRIMAHLRRRFGSELRPDRHDVGPTSSAVSAENAAFRYQVDLLAEFVERWRAAMDGTLRVNDFPDTPEPSSNTRASLHRLEAELTQDLPETVHRDLQADYWNKWAYLARLWVQSGRASEPIRAQLLALTSQYYSRLESIGSALWPPAKLNEAFVAALSRNYDRAEVILNFVLGVPQATETPQTAPTAPDVEQIKTYILAMPLGTPAATVASLVRSAFGPLDAPTLQTVTRALDHAHMRIEFIEEIVGALRQSMSTRVDVGASVQPISGPVDLKDVG